MGWPWLFRACNREREYYQVSWLKGKPSRHSRLDLTSISRKRVGQPIQALELGATEPVRIYRYNGFELSFSLKSLQGTRLGRTGVRLDGQSASSCY